MKCRAIGACSMPKDCRFVGYDRSHFRGQNPHADQRQQRAWNDIQEKDA